MHRSTIYRELKRNAGCRGYRYKQADAKAKERHKAKNRNFKMTNELLLLIEEKLKIQEPRANIWLAEENRKKQC